MVHQIIDNESPDMQEIEQALNTLVRTYGPDILACSDSGHDVFATLQKQADGFRLDVMTWDTTTGYHTNSIASVAVGVHAEDDDDVHETPDKPEAGEWSRDEVINAVCRSHAESCFPTAAQRLREQLEASLDLYHTA